MEISQGVHNLLFNCARCRPGETVLLAYEPGQFGYFDDQLRSEFIHEAEKGGFVVNSVDVGFSPTTPTISDKLLEEMKGVDVVVFLARLGDQLRFSELPAGPRFVVCFAHNKELLSSAFGAADYGAFVELKHVVDQALLEAESIEITCPAGTKIEGSIEDKTKSPEDTSLLRFPMSVFSPVPAAGFSGKFALGGFLTGTGSRYYEPYTVEFEGQVYAHFFKGRLVVFSGKSTDVILANAHYDRVASEYNLARNIVHSWHAGIHPGCSFPGDMRADFEHWGGTAFGNPRVLHFHTCGTYAPGEISWNLFDPTIKINGVAIWEDGVFYPDRLTGGRDVLARFPSVAKIFANPDRRIGLGDVT